MSIEKRDEPTDTVTWIADAALTAAERRAEEEGVTIRAVVLLHVFEGLEEGAQDSAVASTNVDTEEELLEILLVHTKAAADAMNVPMQLMPVLGPKNEG